MQVTSLAALVDAVQDVVIREDRLWHNRILIQSIIAECKRSGEKFTNRIFGRTLGQPDVIHPKTGEVIAQRS
jgi:DNA-directed RNA polymerase beta' subunit